MSGKQEFVYRVIRDERVVKKLVSRISATQTFLHIYHPRREWNPETHSYDPAPYDGRVRVLRAPVGEWEEVTSDFVK